MNPTRIPIDIEDKIALDYTEQKPIKDICGDYSICQRTLYNILKRREMKRRRYMYKPKHKLTKFAKGFIAALIDGEGCISFGVHKRETAKLGFNLKPKIEIANNCKELLNFAQKLMQCGNVMPRSRFRKSAYMLRIDKIGDILHILEQVTDFLFAHKERALLMKEFCKIRAKKWNLMDCNPHKLSYSIEELKIAERLQRMQSVKAKSGRRGRPNLTNLISQARNKLRICNQQTDQPIYAKETKT